MKEADQMGNGAEPLASSGSSERMAGSPWCRCMGHLKLCVSVQRWS